MNRTVQVIILGIVLLIIAAVIGVGLLFLVSGGRPVDFVQKAILQFSLSSRAADLNRAVSTDTTPVRFTVNGGDVPRTIAQNLLNASLITDAQLFVDYARLNDLDRQLEAGTYFLKRSQTLAEIAVALTDSRNSSIPFRIIEGERIEEIAAKIDGAQSYFGFTGTDFLGVAGPGAPIDATFANPMGLPVGASLEGFLFPDTYDLPADVTPTMLRDILTQAFVAKVGGQLIGEANSKGLSMYQVVTLASIVQREAIHSDEQPLIAGVYLNRLAINKQLEADPTVQYAIGFREGTWWPQITVDDYRGVQSPYNTYLNIGLPPGPINSPGLTAITAAIRPTQSDYYFFRADCRSDGYHDFARTFDEHLANCG
ncbi:MAG: endolytic transglycosylase MltG [Anaerolineae bacterium]